MTLQEFIKKSQWSPNNGLDSASNYCGPDLSMWCEGPSRGRDSEILAESNFESALDMLGGEQEGVVEVHRFGHWAGGWYEVILVNPKNKIAIKTLKNIHDLLRKYPILDDTDYYERENEYYADFAEGSKLELAEGLAKHFGLETDAGEILFQEHLVDFAYQLQIECQYYAGNDSCINICPFREPDKNDLDRFKSVMNCFYVAEDSMKYALIEYFRACLEGLE